MLAKAVESSNCWRAVLAQDAQGGLVAHKGAGWAVLCHAEVPLVVEAGGIFEGVAAGEERRRLGKGGGALVQATVKAVELREVVQTGGIGIAAAGQGLDVCKRGPKRRLAALVVSTGAIEGAKLVAERHVFRGGRTAGERNLVSQREKVLRKRGWICRWAYQKASTRERTSMVAPLGKTLPLLGNSRLAICDSITPASRW